jgi:hypothetical protein
LTNAAVGSTLLTVKVTVSIPDAVFRAAENLTKRMSIPRSRLYSIAVETYLKSQTETAVTRKLNRIYSKTSSELEPAMEGTLLEVLRQDCWD